MKIIIILLFILTPFIGKSQLLDSEELYNKVVLLRDINGNTTNTGTGFLVTTKDQYFLVTAKHVADALKIETTDIFFRDSSKTAISFKLQGFLKKPLVSGFNENSDFFILKLETTDMKKLDMLKKSSLNFDVFANDRKSIDRKIDVLVMGYPLFDFEHFTPITFKSYFSSSLINVKFESMPKPFLCYLLENPSMAGFSGGPVFVGVKDRASTPLTKTLIVGIVTGTKYDNTGGKFAIITPAFHLIDLLNNKNGR
jgi:hypothetical protein